MAKTVIFVLFAVAQTICGQCIGPYGPGFPGPALVGPGPALEAYGPGCGPIPGITSNAGFRVTSSSSISPRGLKVQTDSLAIEGPLAVSGQLPFLSVVALEGPLPAIGQGAVSYGCGGNVGILNEVGPSLGPFGYPDARAGYGYPNGCSRGPFY